jgi:hypothetical protein
MMHSLRSQNTALSRLSRHLEQLLFDAAIELLVDANEIPNWSQATIVLDQIHDGEHLPICQWNGGQYKTDQEKHRGGRTVSTSRAAASCCKIWKDGTGYRPKPVVLIVGYERGQWACQLS